MTQGGATRWFLWWEQDAKGTTRKSIAEYSIRAGVDVDAVNDAEVTALHIAGLSEDGVVELLDLGASAGLRDIDGVPTEFYSVVQGDPVSAEKLRAAAGVPTGYALGNGQDRKEWVTEDSGIHRQAAQGGLP